MNSGQQLKAWNRGLFDLGSFLIWRKSALSFYLMFIIGVVFSLSGVITKEIAGEFAVDTYIIGYRFTLFSAGYSLAIFVNGFFLEKINIRQEALTASLLAVFFLLGTVSWQSLGAFSFFLFLFGLAMGVLCSIAYFILINLYDGVERAGKLNLLNFFYSAGAIIAPVLAGIALQQGITWHFVFGFVVVLIIAGDYLICQQKNIIKERKVLDLFTADDSNWNIRIYVMGLALFCYVISEMIFTYWIVIYNIDISRVNIALAGVSLSVFWIFMAIGRLLSGVYINRFQLVNFIVITSSIAAIAYTGLLYIGNYYASLLLVSLMGLGYSGLYATIMSYGTLQVSKPSAKLTTFFLTLGSVGGIVSFLLSSYVKAYWGIVAVMAVAVGLMGLVIVLSLSCGIMDNKR